MRLNTTGQWELVLDPKQRWMERKGPEEFEVHTLTGTTELLSSVVIARGRLVRRNGEVGAANRTANILIERIENESLRLAVDELQTILFRTEGDMRDEVGL